MRNAPDRREIELLIGAHDWWYHTMDLGFGLKTPGHYGENLVPVAALMRLINFKGLKCLDIGAMDGKMAFLMENLGAGAVVASDCLKRETVADLIALFGSKIQYEWGVRDQDSVRLAEKYGLFDFVLCSGVLYHVFSPLEYILAVRRLVKNGGYVLFESACTPENSDFTLEFNCGRIIDDYTTLWVPSMACLRAMIRYACFSVAANATLRISRKQIRLAVLARAERPSELARNTIGQWMRRLYTGDSPGMAHKYLEPQLDLNAFESAEETHVRVGELPRKPLDFKLRKIHRYAVENRFLDIGTPALRMAAA